VSVCLSLLSVKVKVKVFKVLQLQLQDLQGIGSAALDLNR